MNIKCFMKKILALFSLILVIMCFSGWDNFVGFSYDQGYEDGYEKYEQANISNSDYINGYYDGESDSIYDNGCDDGYAGIEPEYPNNSDYMKGYKHGKKDKKNFGG